MEVFCFHCLSKKEMKEGNALLVQNANYWVDYYPFIVTLKFYN